MSFHKTLQFSIIDRNMRNAEQSEPCLAEQTGSSSILVKTIFLA
jgi:hypothetical protein